VTLPPPAYCPSVERRGESELLFSQELELFESVARQLRSPQHHHRICPELCEKKAMSHIVCLQLLWCCSDSYVAFHRSASISGMSSWPMRVANFRRRGQGLAYKLAFCWPAPSPQHHSRHRRGRPVVDFDHGRGSHHRVRSLLERCFKGSNRDTCSLACHSVSTSPLVQQCFLLTRPSTGSAAFEARIAHLWEHTPSRHLEVCPCLRAIAPSAERPAKGCLVLFDLNQVRRTLTTEEVGQHVCSAKASI